MSRWLLVVSVLVMAGCGAETPKSSCDWINEAERYGEVALDTAYNGQKECEIEVGSLLDEAYHRFTAKADTFEAACQAAVELFEQPENRCAALPEPTPIPAAVFNGVVEPSGLVFGENQDVVNLLEADFVLGPPGGCGRYGSCYGCVTDVGGEQGGG